MLLGNKIEDAVLIQEMRDARSVPVVLKTRLAVLRSTSAELLVFVFEGIEDKAIFFHWLNSLAPFLQYEQFVCLGKGKVLDFRELLNRDRFDNNKNVYYFVDHDFDGLRGHEPGPDIFVTDTYSVENQLVTNEVLENVLKVELHCHGEVQCRAAVIARFSSLYSTFLNATRHINQRIFLARKFEIRNSKPWPEKINKLANVSLEAVTETNQDVRQLVVLEREPTSHEVEQSVDEFNALNPAHHYRGKYALAFFSKWLRCLAADRNSLDSIYFADLDKTNKVSDHIPLDALASKSMPPPKLKLFLDSISATLVLLPLQPPEELGPD